MDVICSSEGTPITAERIQYALVIGLPTTVKEQSVRELLEVMAPGLCARFGGFTHRFSEGGWADNAIRVRDVYGPVEWQRNLELSITALPEHHESDFAYIQHCVANAVARLDLPVDRVHCLQTSSTALHFSVKGINQQAAAA